MRRPPRCLPGLLRPVASLRGKEPLDLAVLGLLWPGLLPPGLLLRCG